MHSSYAGNGRGDFHTVHQGKSIDELIIHYMEENNIPGMSLAIVQAPYITRIVGYGVANTQTKQLVASNTVFNIGQLTNMYTAVAIMQLKEEGKLKLDDTISTYLSDLPKNWSEVTIRQLMTHTSGLPCYEGATGFDFTHTYQRNDLINLIKDRPLLFKSGSRMNNSATDAYLLGLIIEKTSGMSYQDYVTKNQIQRIGLKHTFFIHSINSLDNEINNGTNPFKHSQFLHNPTYINPTELAAGYTQKDEANAPIQPLSWSATFAEKGMIASAEDISLWDISLAGDILIKNPEDRAFLYNPIKLSNGQTIPGNVGWLFPGHPGLMEIKGNIPGYSAFLSRFTAPSELLCVTLLANKDNLPDLDVLARKIAGAFDKNLAVPTSAPWSETIQSPYSVAQTIERIKTIIQAQGGTIFAHINHGDEAKKVEQSLQPTEVLIIGNPAKGTALMQANTAFALDLPLRIMATEDSSGQVWLSCTNPVALSKAYGVNETQKKLLQQMSHTLQKICHKAISSQSE